MAGAGKKTFQVNEVLSAADVNQYLMDQSVMRFADSSARSSAIGTPSEGMVSYLDDTDQVEVYDGSQWVNFTGDITQVTAGTALTGGGTEGNVTLNVDISALATAQAGTALTASGETLNVDDATPTSVGVVKGSTVDDNTALGNAALGSVTSGGFNTAVGNNALSSNTTASENNAFGGGSLQNNEDGARNNAFGNGSLLDNVSGDDNSAFGNDALRNNTASDNSAFGAGALLSNTTGDKNVAVGTDALRDNTTASENTAIGVGAGDNTTTGLNNSSLGYAAQPSSTTVSNQITLGNSSISTLRCNQTSISSLSDARDKTNVQDTSLGLDLINRLRPVTFDWDRRDGSMQGYKDVGFIAQEVIEVEDNLDIHDTLRMSSRENEEKYEVAPARLIPVLTRAIQELSEQNAELRARLDKLEGN